MSPAPSTTRQCYATRIPGLVATTKQAGTPDPAVVYNLRRGRQPREPARCRPHASRLGQDPVRPTPDAQRLRARSAVRRVPSPQRGQGRSARPESHSHIAIAGAESHAAPRNAHEPVGPLAARLSTSPGGSAPKNGPGKYGTKHRRLQGCKARPECRNPLNRNDLSGQRGGRR